MKVRPLRCVVAAAAALAVGAGALPRPVRAHNVGEIVPFVRATDLEGREVSLGDLVASRRVAIVFWDWRRATSIRALNLLDELRGRFAGRGFEVLAVEGEGASREAVAERLEKLRSIGTRPSYPVVPDPGGRIARQFRVESTPQIFLLDGAGRVAYHLETFRTEVEGDLVEAVRNLVGDVAAQPSALVPARRLPAAGSPPEATATPETVPPRRETEDPRRALLERHRYFGGYHFNRGDYAKAEESYRKYLELAPEDVGAWLRLGEVLARAGAFDGARDAWERALRLDPGNAEADASIRRLIRGEYGDGPR